MSGSSGTTCEDSKSLRVETGPFTAPEPVLFGYGPSDLHAYRDAARYVDRILKGAKPGELPIEQATRFELVVTRPPGLLD